MRRRGGLHESLSSRAHLRDRLRFLTRSSAPVTLCTRNWRTTGKPERRFRVDSDPLRSPHEFAMVTKVEPVRDGYHTVTPYRPVGGAGQGIRCKREAPGDRPRTDSEAEAGGQTR